MTYPCSEFKAIDRGFSSGPPTTVPTAVMSTWVTLITLF